MATTTSPRKSSTRQATTRQTATRKTTARKTTVRKTAAPSPAAKTEKPTKLKKPKLVRDSFTIPKDEYAVIHALKARGEKLARPVKKSELLRAGIKLLATLSDTAFKTALGQVPVIKTGRPKSAK